MSPHRPQALTKILAVLVLPLLLILAAAAPSHAAAYTKSVYAPNELNSTTLEGWGDLSRNCSGTYGCYNYMKIERKAWYGAVYVGGGWVNKNGWNKIRVTQPKNCHYYRTTVDSYNDVLRGYGSGVDMGPVGSSDSDTKIHRYKTTWSSGWKRHCR